MSPYLAQLLQIAAGLIAALILCRAVIALKINDLPDGKRKVQNAPVPSSGGLGIAGAGMLGWVVALNGLGVEDLPAQTYVLVLTILAGLLVGLIDDMGFIGTKTKLAVLWAIVIASATQIYVTRPYWIAELGAPPLLDSMPPIEDNMSVYRIALIMGSAFWLFVVMNAVNFMDGSNGLMAGSVAIMMIGVIMVELIFVGYSGLAQMPFLAINAAIIGFLFWNMRGKLYAGDAGSLFLGGLFAASGLILVRNGDVSVFTPATFALPVLTDVILTVIWRARRGQNILQAHRDHAYQLFIRAGWSHWKVALLWWAGSLSCVCAGVFAFMMRGPFPAITFAAGTVLGILAWTWQRRMYGPRVGAV